MIIMEASCIAQIFPSRKLNALAHTIHANIQTDIYQMQNGNYKHTNRCKTVPVST